MRPGQRPRFSSEETKCSRGSCKKPWRLDLVDGASRSRECSSLGGLGRIAQFPTDRTQPRPARRIIGTLVLEQRDSSYVDSRRWLCKSRLQRTEGAVLLTKILAVTALTLLTSSSALAAAGGCHTITGTFTTQSVPCVVPALVCVESQVAGDLEGTGLILITGFDPATQVFTGTSTNFLTNGAVLEGTIVGAMGSVVTFTGGTRQFAHATGSFVTDGAGNYTGEYCLGNGAE